MKSIVALALVAAVSVTTAVPAWSQGGPIRQPGVVRSEKLSKSEVLITWKDRSDNEANFEIQRIKAGTRVWRTRGFTPADVTEFVDTVKPSSVFTYRVIAHNEFESSPFSNECFVNRTPPTRPTPVRARLVGLTRAKLTWGDVSRGETGFRIVRREPGSGFRQVVELPPNTEEFLDTELDPASSYFYKIRALGTPTKCIKHSKFSPERIVTTKGGVRVMSVILGGTGKGVVTSEPNGIVCGPQRVSCDAEYPVGTKIRLSHDANRNSVFKRWVGASACLGETGDCVLNLGKDKDVFAVFKRKRQ